MYQCTIDNCHKTFTSQAALDEHQQTAHSS